jgi:hypothetical protein
LRLSQPPQFAVTIAVRSWWYAVSVKAEPVEENKKSGIILDLTRCGQRLNNRAAILQSKITSWDGSSSPAEESAGAGGAIIEVASQRATRLGGVLARRRPPTASLSSRRMPEPNTGDRNSHGSRVDEFGPKSCGAVPRTSLQDQGAARKIEDYYDFPMGLDF